MCSCSLNYSFLLNSRKLKTCAMTKIPWLILYICYFSHVPGYLWGRFSKAGLQNQRLMHLWSQEMLPLFLHKSCFIFTFLAAVREQIFSIFLSTDDVVNLLDFCISPIWSEFSTSFHLLKEFLYLFFCERCTYFIHLSDDLFV